MLHRIIVIPYVTHYGDPSPSIGIGFVLKTHGYGAGIHFPQTTVEISDHLTPKETEEIILKEVKGIRATLTKDTSNCLIGGLKSGFSVIGQNSEEEICDFYTLRIHAADFAPEIPGQHLQLLDEYKTNIKLTFVDSYDHFLEHQFSTDAIKQLGFLLYYIYIAKPFIDQYPPESYNDDEDDNDDDETEEDDGGDDGYDGDDENK